MQNKLYTYQQVASTSSSPLEQIVMLYDGAIKFLMQAAEDIKQKDILAKAEHIDRALAIVNYLRDILDMKQGGEVAAQLDQVYELVSRDVLRASATLDASYLETPLNSLRELRSAWQQIAAPQKAGAPAGAAYPAVGEMPPPPAPSAPLRVRA